MAEKFMTGKDLTRRRGWSSYTIQQFLGEADKKEVRRFPNTTFTITLFSVDRVEAAEQDPEWQALAEGQYYRRRRAERTESRVNAMDRVRTFDVKVRHEELDRQFIVEAALENYNEFRGKNAARAGNAFTPVTLEDATPNFLIRVTLNYLRHNLTNYDYAIKKLAVNLGSKEEYVLLRSRYFDALRQHFPDFAEALTNQEDNELEHEYELYLKALPKK